MEGLGKYILLLLLLLKFVPLSDANIISNFLCFSNKDILFRSVSVSERKKERKWIKGTRTISNENNKRLVGGVKNGNHFLKKGVRQIERVGGEKKRKKIHESFLVSVQKMIIAHAQTILLK